MTHSTTGAAAAAPGPGTYVTIVGHSDDDLLFISPDTQQTIASGCPTTVIVLTADEFDGTDTLTREQLAAQLHDGTRGAYARLAGVPNTWDRKAVTVGGRAVEIDTLTPAPRVRLVFVDLPDGLDDNYDHALTNLWGQPGFTTPTVVPTNSPVRAVQQYDRNVLLAVLGGLLDQFQPTTIRLQDPVPDPRYLDGRPEHEDHIAASWFGRLAARNYRRRDGGYVMLTHYHGYQTDQFPVNVPEPLVSTKLAAYAIYQNSDPLSGDDFVPNVSRNYRRWPVGAPWVARDGGGALYAVAAVAGNIVYWKQASGATTWTGPTSLATGSFAPGVTVNRNADGRLQIAALDIDGSRILTAAQTAVGAGFGPWQDLGNPDGLGTGYGALPALGVNAAGGLEMVARNQAGGLSNAFQVTPGKQFETTWYDVGGGPDVQDPAVLHTTANGSMHVFVGGRENLVHWVQPANGAITLDTGFPVIECTAAPAVAGNADGRVEGITREYTDGAVGTVAQQGSGWTGLVHLGGNGGLGSPAAVLTPAPDQRIMVFEADNTYGVSLARQTARNGGFGAWTVLGGFVEIGPTAIVDAAGLVRVLAIGGDVRLYERKQTSAGADGAFGAWQAF